VDEVIDALNEASEHVAAEERTVALLAPDGELIIEIGGEGSRTRGVITHETRLATSSACGALWVAVIGVKAVELELIRN